MARTLLENANWERDDDCFVCQPRNGRGLGVPFYLDEETERVVAEFTPEPWQSGPPNIAHDGVALALLSEAMVWAVIALAHRWGVMRNLQTVFHRPVRVGQAYTVGAWVEGSAGNDMAAAAEIRDARDRLCVAVRGAFYLMTEDEAARSLGTPGGEGVGPAAGG